MAEEKLMTIDPNIAEEKELMELPGIGPALAKRIIAARPFVDADDMQRVPGLGTTNLERIKLFLDLAPRQLAREIAQIDQAPEASGISDGLQEEQPHAHILPEEDQKVHLPEEEQRLEPVEPKPAGPQKALQKLHALREATPGPDPGPGKKPFSRGESGDCTNRGPKPRHSGDNLAEARNQVRPDRCVASPWPGQSAEGRLRPAPAPTPVEQPILRVERPHSQSAPEE